jgi:hypothetical protein
VLVDVHCLPRVADPDIANGTGGVVAVLHHLSGQSALLLLVLVLY